MSGSAYFYNKKRSSAVGTLPISGFMVCEVVELDVIGIDSASQIKGRPFLTHKVLHNKVLVVS